MRDILRDYHRMGASILFYSAETYEDEAAVEPFEDQTRSEAEYMSAVGLECSASKNEPSQDSTVISRSLAREEVH